LISSLLFDASSILLLVRGLGERAPDILVGSSTIPLAYYEAGNAVWRECFLLKRIDENKAAKLLRSIFAIIRKMDIVRLEDEEFGVTILDVAGSLNVTYYDASYLVGARELHKTLVTDDEKLMLVAEKMGIKTIKSTALTKSG